MEGKGRALNHVYVERLWRSVKYEYADPYTHATKGDLYRGLGLLRSLTPDGPQQCLNCKKPAEITHAARV